MKNIIKSTICTILLCILSTFTVYAEDVQTKITQEQTLKPIIINEYVTYDGYVLTSGAMNLYEGMYWQPTYSNWSQDNYYLNKILVNGKEVSENDLIELTEDLQVEYKVSSKAKTSVDTKNMSTLSTIMLRQNELNNQMFSNLESELEMPVNQKSTKASSYNAIRTYDYNTANSGVKRLQNILLTDNTGSRIGDYSKYLSLSKTSNTNDTVTLKSITVNNKESYNAAFYTQGSIIMQVPNINSTSSSDLYTEADSGSITWYAGIGINGNSSFTFPEKVTKLTAYDNAGNPMKFVLDSRAAVNVWVQDYSECMPTSIKNITVNDSTRIVDFGFNYSLTPVHNGFLNNFLNASNSNSWSVTPYKNGTVVCTNIANTAEKYTYRYTGLAGRVIEMPDLRNGVTYNWVYTPDVAGPAYANAISTPATSGTVTFVNNIQYTDLAVQIDNQYVNIESNLFYDLNRNGKQDAGETSINDSTERNKITLSPYTQDGSGNDMFYQSNPNTKKVIRQGTTFAEYTGTVYKAVKVQNGISITFTDLYKSNVVQVPAPVYVYCNISGKLFYDTDRNVSYASAYDKYANGTLKLTHTLDGVSKTETITVTNGSYNIAKIESGTYDYTFTPNDNANLVSTTGKITIAPTSTPNAQGIATCTVDIPLNVQNQITIQGYYDNNFNDTYDSGDTLIDNTATVYNDKLNMFTTTSKVINVWNAGTYTIKSLNNMQPKDVYYNKDLSFDITVAELQSGNAETIYVGYRPPAEITGSIINQWGTPIENTVVTYNGYTATTDSNGDFAINVPYTDGSKDVEATQTNYSNIVKPLTLNPKNNLGKLVQNKNFYTVTGNAKDTNGNVISNAIVTINGKSVKTNSNGVYTIDIPYAE